MKKLCKTCKRPTKSKKFCSRICYYKSKFIEKNPCKVKNCVYKLKAQAHGLCINHYIIWRNHGNPRFKIRRRRGTGSFEQGYKIIVIKGKRIREHRYIIEKKIGRKLNSNEVVHHINGNRSDNRVKNLEVISRKKHTRHHNFERWEKEGASSFGR